MSFSKYTWVAVLIAISTASCKKWLDVQPKTEMRRDELFTTQTGFQDALSGAYIKLKDADLYGYNLTIGALEHLVSSWDVVANSTNQRINRFIYQDAGVESAFSQIFSKQYNVIASVNAILDQIETKKSVFSTPGMYEMIKGECLALRAYVHFDLLRLYGPVPVNTTGEPIIPYVKTLSIDHNPRLSFEAFKNAVMADLEEADKLLKNIDPVLQYSLVVLLNPNGPLNDFRPDDPYKAFRQFRMNYYAVKALQARAWAWFGDKQKAFELAKLVVDAKNSDGTSKFALGTDADMVKGDFVLTREHIWSLYDFELFRKYTDYFKNPQLYKGKNDAAIKTDLYGAGSEKDIRALKLWEPVVLNPGGNFYVTKKYSSAERYEFASDDTKRWPMLRISEMYLLMVECGPAADAQAAWNAFCIARGMVAAQLPADPAAVTTLVNKEFRKEFFAEGQAFYAYKRINAPTFLWAPPGFAINYVVPVPRNEFTR
ncbi:RagB/SusD family nutrient uptake outer membrane protein [Pseudoflavitalea sp. G-6-1-2]|uniref:RagB/SusD family nutrient uptake outer membrane protein n=1 Tax=Pseudoflavitalea sp. G-6-1-2 TaxID=2728841 RepID=UPI00146CC499|nr:RagB/SusD family nutrient uptake outer membrane protein [Pseudoflavitalea sp. G-6-1-2]NML22887.1 RagB/SusD family nutrient uptake outer membrane protein [Pseudoflavitalea sp. G-6-1-2]